MPPSRLTEALGWTSTGMATGVALGAAALGRVIDGWGAGGGFTAMVGVGVLLVVAAILIRSPRPAVAGPGETEAGETHPSALVADQIRAEPGTPAAVPDPSAAETRSR